MPLPNTPKKKPLIDRLMLVFNVLSILAIFATYVSFHLNPAHLGYLPVIGLAYPHILILNFGFVVYWILRRWKYGIFSTLAIAIGFNHVGNCIALNVGDTAGEEGKSISVMTYNTHLFGVYWNRGKGLRDSIFAQLEEAQPDIICFQEFYQSEASKKFHTRDTLIELLDASYYHERYTHATSGKEYFGVAMFSKYPIIHKGYIPFEEDVNNFCIYADIKIGMDTLRVYDGHLASIRFQRQDYALFDDQLGGQEVEDGIMRIMKLLKSGYVKRGAQAKRVMESVKSSPYPVVLCGDFNDTPSSYCYHVLTEDLKDSFVEKGKGLGNTYIGILPAFLRIDYVLVSPEINVLSYERLPQEFSDHHALKVKISL